jgi:hypothetical protein
LSSFIGCVLGGAVWRRSSYLAEREGTRVASGLVEIVDDPLIARGPGSRAFDGEGLASRKNVVVEGGMLRTFLLDSYSARKLKRQSTASAGRSGGGVSASTSNLILKAGQQTPEQLIAATPRGLYVTEMMGFGFNAVTGDFSRGASGFWIEDGKLAFPVSEIVTSETGKLFSPFSIQKPPAPRLKSPVTALKPKPIISVTYRPFGVEASNASGVSVPGSSQKLVVDGPTPPLRAADAVERRPSFRAL